MISGGGEPFAVIWLIGFFVLRNGWFILFEMGGRGATPGKRLMGLRVVARDGARLTGGAVIARNAMREIEVFLPLSFLGAQRRGGHGGHLPDHLLPAVERDFPVLPAVQPRPAADRRPHRRHLGGPDAAHEALVRPGRRHAHGRAAASPTRRSASTAFTSCRRWRRCSAANSPTRIATVARIIRKRPGSPDEGDDYGFLSDYYAALCTRLEGGLMVGRRRENKLEQLQGR